MSLGQAWCSMRERGMAKRMSDLRVRLGVHDGKHVLIEGMLSSFLVSYFSALFS